MTAPQSPSSWRDVYTLVQDVEGRLSKRMDDIAETAKTATTDHEVRIRVLEATDQRAVTRNRTITSTVNIGRTTLLLIISIGSGVLALAAFLQP